ncbi:MAG: alpha/beta fold hydrolase [Solirubrobacteraceae bacterium]
MLRALLPRRRGRRPVVDSGPPIDPPPGRVVNLPGRGEVFVRDSAGGGPAVLLLHGWMVSADINWLLSYQALSDAGYRVIALDHRGHGRGLRTVDPFRLDACADDAAAVVAALDAAPAIAVGYSMGGPIVQLLARRHPRLLRGMVLCATTREWRGRDYERLWRTMGVVRVVVSLSPFGFWTTLLRVMGMPEQAHAAWLVAELGRGAPAALAEAGRELGRFDSRGWLDEVRTPAAVVVTALDRSVPPSKQRAMAAQLGARTFDVSGDHLVVAEAGSQFNAVLLAALEHVRDAAGP